MPRVRANEVHLGWREWGKGDTTVAFIHGNLANKDWIELAAWVSSGSAMMVRKAESLMIWIIWLPITGPAAKSSGGRMMR